MADVVDLKTGQPAGDGLVIDPDRILEGHKGKMIQVVVAGFTSEGEFIVASSHGSRDALWIIDGAHHFVLVETRE